MPEYKVGDKFYCDSDSNQRIEIISISPNQNIYGDWIYFIEETLESDKNFVNYDSVRWKYIDDCFNPL